MALLGACGGGSPSTPTGSRATNTLAFGGGIYVVSNLDRASGLTLGMNQVWPQDSGAYYTGFKFDGRRFAFRPTDQQLFYISPSNGLLIDDDPGENDTQVPTLPCQPGASVLLNWNALGFDAQGVVYYECDGHLRRGNAELVGMSTAMSGVLADGRYVRTVGADSNSTYGFAVIAPDGTTLSTLTLGTASEQVEPLPTATTVAGNDAFVLFSHTVWDATVETSLPLELIAYRVDSHSNWLPVVRRAFTRYSTGRTILPDGTILVIEDDREQPMNHHTQVTALLPDGGERVVWRDRQSNGTVFDNGQLIVGPSKPTGPSVRTR